MNMSQQNLMRKVVRHEATIQASVEKIFPLLCPVREYEWIDGWSCRLAFSSSGIAERGAVFTTGFREEGESVWTMSRYEPNRLIEFVVVFPGSHVLVAEVSLRPDGPSGTCLSWSAAFTSLVENNPYLAGVSQESFDREQAYFDRALGHFCATGTMLRR
jgi:hypothetical protein